jgi:chromosome segregation ATPase
VDSVQTSNISQIFSQDESSGLFNQANIRIGDSNESIVRLLKDIESKVTVALRFFGVDTRFVPKFVQNLKGAVKPACISAVGCFVVLHIFPAIGISTLAGFVCLVKLAVSWTRLEIMKEDLDTVRASVAVVQSDNEKLKEQNSELSKLNGEQLATISDQKTEIDEARNNLRGMGNNLSEAQENLEKEQQLVALKDQQSATLEVLVEMQKQQLQEQQAYIGQCQDCLSSVFVSQSALIDSLRARLNEQAEVVQRILGDLENIAQGEGQLTDALGWAIGQITAAQSKLTSVIGFTTDITDAEKLKKLIGSGEFAQKAKEMQDNAQEAYNIMNGLNSGLTQKILDAQKNISDHRQAAQRNLAKLTDENKRMMAELSHNRVEITNKRQEIAHNQREIARLTSESQEKSKKQAIQIEALKSKITAEQKSLGDLQAKKGSLEQNLRDITTKSEALQGNIGRLELLNRQLQEQCERQQGIIEQQERTIAEQGQRLEDTRKELDALKARVSSQGWLAQVGGFVGGVATAMILNH